MARLTLSTHPKELTDFARGPQQSVPRTMEQTLADHTRGICERLCEYCRLELASDGEVN